ncbi:hypothetical protein EVG20_g7796 [Dentipellis fragilis]|uniref:Uncharacterized protein n=1 Tax=Dentipellis fragilis TaxID=205917 RepID=A0A4Y9YCW0_9AGAM|nr:hypothetical protein EVG20_g7796 [Dentipellis fragilis]
MDIILKNTDSAKLDIRSQLERSRRVFFSICIVNHGCPMSSKSYDLDTPLKLRLRPILRMADEFQVDVLHDHIMAQLVSDWPQTIRQWDKTESEIKTRVDTGSSVIWYGED